MQPSQIQNPKETVDRTESEISTSVDLAPTTSTSYKIVVQNVYKLAHLASDLIIQHDPDIALIQEINLYSEDAENKFEATVSRYFGYGTAIYSKQPKALSEVRHVDSPHKEWLVVTKMTTVALCCNIDFVSFHGYNGTPFRSLVKLMDHVQAVLDVLVPDRPCVFAGDFNSK
jgi:hypothetical protein